MASATTRRASTDYGIFSGTQSLASIASSSPPAANPAVHKAVRMRPPNAHLPQRSPSSSNTSVSSSASSIPPLSSSPATSDRSSPFDAAPSPPRKRKSLNGDVVVEITPPDDPKPKRAKTTGGRKRKSNHWSKPIDPKPLPRPDPTLSTSIYRNSRSRSTSTFQNPESECPTFKRNWRSEGNGDPGSLHLSSEMVVKRLMKSYKAFFKNPNDPDDKTFEPHPTNPPVAELEYPNSHASERFILLAPKDKDHYNPVWDLEKSLCTIIEHYCTPEQQALFGDNPNDWRSEGLSPPPSPEPEPKRLPTSRRGSSSKAKPPLIRRFKRALHFEDGPAFSQVMDEINALIRSFKYPETPDDLLQPAEPNTLMRTPEKWTEVGLPKGVLMRIVEENYQRTVGPNVPKLKRYEAFSSTVYGELMPNLIDEMVKVTGLNEDSLFLDLGSGVGNVVVQASLQTGCRSFGIELMPEPARVAEDVVVQMEIRAKMWGIKMGKVKVVKGDMLESEEVDKLMSQADVVLVDNKVFTESLNEALKPKFLDLKEGAIVISLAPFVTPNARVTERNVDDITAIFDVTEKTYGCGSVSWGNSAGHYYLHRVDRTGYAEIRDKFETVRKNMRPLRRRS